MLLEKLTNLQHRVLRRLQPPTVAGGMLSLLAAKSAPAGGAVKADATPAPQPRGDKPDASRRKRKRA